VQIKSKQNSERLVVRKLGCIKRKIIIHMSFKKNSKNTSIYLVYGTGRRSEKDKRIISRRMEVLLVYQSKM